MALDKMCFPYENHNIYNEEYISNMDEIRQKKKKNLRITYEMHDHT